MSKQRWAGRRPVAALVGIMVGLATIGVFAGAAGSAPQRGQEMPTPRSTPGISGKAQEGETLTATSGQWLYADGLPCSSRPLEPCILTWQWQRCNPQATSCADIPGQTNGTYLLAGADVGQRIRVIQTLTKNDCDAHGKNCKDVSNSQVSNPTGLIAPKPVASPVNTQLPEITGRPMEEETLTASTGLWNGPQPISVAFQWYRCDKAGNNPVPIAGANQQTYKLTSADVGFTIRVTGTATNAGGSAFATSRQTPVIAAFAPTPQHRSITVDRVALPQRLIIDRVAFAPTALRSLTPFTARFRVSDTRGFLIQNALVAVKSVPPGLVAPVREVRTDRNGWATFRLTPTKRLQLKNGWLYFFVEARKAGEPRQAGVSAARLAQVRLVAPQR